jgi:hypothetical protein
MSLIGDAIIAGRQRIPDMPQVLGPPILDSVTLVSSTSGPLFGPDTWLIQLTLVNSWGETIPSNSIILAVPGSLNDVTIVYSGTPGLMVFIYASVPSQNVCLKFSTNIGGGTFNLSNATPIGNSIPPQMNRAFLPDTDGPLVGAYAIYQWLNDALKIISRKTGGLLDYSGVPSVINQPLYQIQGQWSEITSVWYDGYWMTGGDRGQFFRRNTITSQILSAATISVINNIMVMEVYPQPARTAAATTLAAPMGATDTVANLTSTAGFVLPFGFFQVDGEIMSYKGIVGNQLTGLIRGLGGSAASSHLASAPTNELNIFWNGKRLITPAYAPGNSLTVLPAPEGWGVLVGEYIGMRAKDVEHDYQARKVLEDSIDKAVKEWAGNTKQIARRRQVGGLAGPAVLYPDVAGGIILP